MTHFHFGLRTLLIVTDGLLFAAPRSAYFQSITLTVNAESYVAYPSMNPVTAIGVSLTDPAAYDFFKKVYAHGWDCTAKTNYRVTVVSTQNGQTISRSEAALGIVIEGDDEKGNRLISCTTGRPGQLQLIIPAHVSANETVKVTLLNLPAGYSAESDGKLSFPSGTLYTFTATPQAAPSEALVNEKKRDTGQLNVNLSDSNLFGSRPIPVTVYAKSVDLFSTDEKDSKSAFSATLGAQRGLLSRWYFPFHLEQAVQGNQVATNLSSVTAAGFTTLIPWSWSAVLFNNKVIQAPLPPDVTINNQYTHRINQIIAPKAKPLATDDYSGNPYGSWSAIQFPWACSVFSWINNIGKSKPTNLSGQYCLGTELDLGMYYLPLDLTKRGTQRAEGYGDVSILVPLKGLQFVSRFLPYLTSSDPTKAQIRIKYSDSVNAANNYARSRQWTYGIELMK